MGFLVVVLIAAMMVFNVFVADFIMKIRSDIQVIRKALGKDNSGGGSAAAG